MARKTDRYKLAADGRRWRLQHPDPNRPGRYVPRRWDTEAEGRRFLADLDRYGLEAACEADDARKGKATRAPRWSTTPLGQYVRETYLPSRGHAKNSTEARRSQAAVIDAHPIAAMAICDIRATHVQKFKAWLDTPAARQGHGTGPLADNYQKQILELVRATLAYADAARDIEFHPARTAVVSAVDVEDQRPACPITLAEFDAIMAHVPDPASRTLFRIMLATGARIGEALGIDWAKIIPTTRRGIVDVFLPGTKSQWAPRWVDMPAANLSEMTRRAAGRMFAHRHDRYHESWSKAVADAQDPEKAAAAGFPVLTKTPRPHDLRHTHAGFLYESGADIFAISRRMGHGSVAITEGLYGKITDDHRADTGSKVADLMARKRAEAERPVRRKAR